MAEHLACAPFATKAQFVAAGCQCDLTSPADDAIIEALLWDATDVAVSLVQGAYRGPCTITLRPSRESCTCGWRDSWSNWSSAYGAGHCRCTIDRLPLSGTDPRTFTVKIDGDVVDPTTYGVTWFYGKPYLTRRRATSDPTLPTTWPHWQDLTLPATEDHTFEVTYTFGPALGPMETNAAIEIACEMAKSYVENRAARLPKGAESATFQGLSVSIDPNAAPDASMAATARFVAFYMPGGHPPTEVWSPDLDEGWSFPVRQ